MRLPRLFPTFCLLASTALLGGFAIPAVAKQPNILLITVDDLNHWVHHLGRNPQAITPNIDRLAARGVSFTRAYTASPVCNPSRTAFLTGMRPSTTGVYGNATSWRGIIPDGYTLPGWLRAHGYTTFGVGKLFHTSKQIRESDWDAYPQNPTDESLHQVESSNASTLAEARAQEAAATRRTLRYTAGELSIAELAADDDAVSDHATVSAAIAALQARDGAQPFFIGCGIFRPHLPWHVPAKYFDLYPEETIALPPYLANDLADVPDGKPTEEHLAIVRAGLWKKAIRAYLACVTYADTEVGRLLDALDASPHRDNTIVVLLGDHGWHLGEKDRWRKTMLWEEGNRLPYVWAGPGIAENQQAAQVVDLMSLFPTLVDLAGLPAPDHLDGVSIAPVLRNPAAAWEGPPALGTWHFNNHTVRTDRWRYLRWDNGNEELYDHAADPYEWYNLLHPSNADRIAGIDVPAVVAELRAHFPAVNRTPEEAKAWFATRQPSQP